MSYYVVEPPRRERLAWVSALVATVVLIALALFAGWAAAMPVRITVDGDAKSVRSGTTMRELAEAGVLRGRAGDLIGIDGSVVEPGGGESPAVTRNGRPARMTQRLYPGDIIVSSSGTDRRESIVTTEVAVPFQTRYEGTGSITELSALGSPGIRRVTRGEVSGIEITSTVLREPSDMVISRVRPVTGKLVALTFDDGPWPGQTNRILDILKRYEVKGTFFVVGKMARRNPALARRIVREGHDIGTHTYGHVYLTKVPPKKARFEIVAGKKAVEDVTGHRTSWIRPPYGAINSRSWAQIRKLKMTVVLWDVDSRDWSKPGMKKIEQTVMRTTKPGSVVLFHDGGGSRYQTIAALPRIIRRLRAQGYTFVTVDELVDARSKAAAAKRAKARKAAAKRRATSGSSGG